MSKVIAVVNQKGGVGKTTTSVNLSAELSQKNKKVLLIDFDPQSNASSGFGVYEDDVEASIYDVLMGDEEVKKALYPTAVPKLHILPSTRDLAGAEVELVNASNREYLLKEKIRNIKDEYDYVLIDCPPSLGLITINALTAADEVLIPVQCEYYALEGLSRLLTTIKLVQQEFNKELIIGGILMTMFDKRTSLSKQVFSDAKEHFGDQLFESVIPRNIRLTEAPSFGEPISIYDPLSKGAKAYKKLAKEIITNEKR